MESRRGGKGLNLIVCREEVQMNKEQQHNRTFSVVIPTYNRERLVVRAIASVQRQTYRDFEIIVVDDGSKDRTSEIVQSVAKMDRRIRYVYQENQGAQFARNHGLHIARGEYIAFLDSDDEWMPTFLESMMAVYANDLSADCVYCLEGCADKNGIVSLAKSDYMEGYIYSKVLEQGFLTGPLCMTMKRHCFDVIGNWDTELKACQDDDICFRLTKNFKFVLIPKILAFFRGIEVEPNNRISASALRVAGAWWQLWHKYEEEVLIYCGKRTMAKHYLECAARFKKSGNSKMWNEALAKANGFYVFDNEWKNWLDRCSARKAYFYGTGKYGFIAKRFWNLKDIGIKIEGFVVSRGEDRVDFFEESPVCFQDEIPGFSNVILTCSQIHHQQIMALLSERKNIHIYTIPDELFTWMEVQI